MILALTLVVVSALAGIAIAGLTAKEYQLRKLDSEPVAWGYLIAGATLALVAVIAIFYDLFVLALLFIGLAAYSFAVIKFWDALPEKKEPDPPKPVEGSTLDERIEALKRRNR